MRHSTKITVVFLVLTLVGANALTAEEETYSPIPELNYNPPKTPGNSSMLDDMRLHAGAAFINSFQSIPLAGGQRVQGGMQGGQFNFGIDLFSQNWILQGILFSLPQTTINQAQVSENGFELRFVYENSLMDSITYHGGLGVESRNYSIRSSLGDNSMASGAWVLATGVDYWPAPFLSAGIEFSGHLPMSNSNDPSSLDFGVRLNGHF